MHPDASSSPAGLLFQANAELAEGPIWDGRTGSLYWVDIRRCRVSRLAVAERAQTDVWITPARPGCIALTDDPDRLVVVAGADVALLDLATGDSERLAILPIETPRFRANDGRVDSRGRLWVGTMIDDIHRPESFRGGELFCVEASGRVTRAPFDFELPNGIGWSLDDQLLYLNDTTTGVTWSFDFDAVSGAIDNRRPFFDHRSGTGYPDGLSVDSAGAIWSAQWDGWNLRRIAPDGGLLAEFPMPVRRPSSATFFGDRLDQIAVTSATVDFTSEDFRMSPLAGALLEMPAPGMTGRAENRFAL